MNSINPALEWKIAALRVEVACLYLIEALRRKDFNPDQPRVPAGNPDGGQWTGESESSAFESDELIDPAEWILSVDSEGPPLELEIRLDNFLRS